MKRILTALILIPLVLLLVFRGSELLVTLAVAAVASLAAWEFLGLAEKTGANPPRIAVLVAIVTLFLCNYEWPDQITAVVGVLSLSLLAYCTFFQPVEESLPNAATGVFCLLYVGLTLIALPLLLLTTNGPSLVTFLLCTVWAGDIAALYVGRSLGRHKLAPSLSPNKTWEGAIGSIIGSVAVAAALLGLATLLESMNSARLYYPDGYLYWLPLAALINVAAQIGDLVESALKRSAGVKDSGTLLPGHGGILDRIDALLLAAPVLWYAQVIHQRF